MSRRSTSRSLLATLLIFLAGIITIGVLYAQLFTTSVSINNNAMSPTLPLGTTAIINSRVYAGQLPKRGEIVLANTSSNTQTLARIVGLPSEAVTITDSIHINNVPLEEPYASGQLTSIAPISLDAQTYLLIIDVRPEATPLIVTKDQLVGPALWYTGGQLPLATVQHYLHQ